MRCIDNIAAWDIAETQRLIDHPAVRLLRSPNGALTLTFLHRAFKEQQNIAIPESQLRARLENFLDEAREQRPGAYPQTAADYLAAWCGAEHVLLKKFYSDGVDEPVFELTMPAERAMQWLEDLQTRPFVGAESRLELIFRQLEEIALFSTPDVERRVAGLRSQQSALQAQIDEIAATQSAPAYSDVQLTERFANALDLARGLTGDFRQLEENFKEVARNLARAQSQPGATKGRMVGQLLDTHSALKESAQGQSFYAFWNLLSSPERQHKWRDLVRTVYQLESIDGRLRANKLIERLSTRLLIEGERVVRSNERMAATLRRALESVSTGEDRQLRELIRDIHQLALTCRQSPPTEEGFFELMGPAEPFATFSRTFWQPDATGQMVGSMRFNVLPSDPKVLERFLALADLNLTRLREQVRRCLVTSDAILLSEILERYPPSEGILEVVGYLVIANQDLQHCLAGDQFVEVEIRAGGIPSEIWRIPEVLFTRDE